MALFKTVSGDAADLDEIEKTPGYAYFTEEDHKLHVDVGDKRKTLDAEGADGVYLKDGDEYVRLPGDPNEKGVLIPARQLISSCYQVELIADRWKERNGKFYYLLDNVFEKRRDNALIPPIISPLVNMKEYSAIDSAEVQDGSENGKVSIEFTTSAKPSQNIVLIVLVIYGSCLDRQLPFSFLGERN